MQATRSRDLTPRTVKYLVGRSVLAPLLAAAFALTTAWGDPLEDEFKFAAGLVEWGMPDWSAKVLDELQRQHPDQEGRIKVIRAEGLLAQRKLADVEAILKGMKADDPKTVAWLLEHKVNVNAIDKYGESAIGHAAHNNRPEIVKLLLAVTSQG